MRIIKAKYILTLGVLLLFSQVFMNRGHAFEHRYFDPPVQPPAEGFSIERPLETVPPSQPSAGEEPVPIFSEPSNPPQISSPQITLSPSALTRDTTLLAPDSLAQTNDSLVVKRDSAKRVPFLDDILSGKSQDSLVFFPKAKLILIYEKGDVLYQDNNIKADFMRFDLNTKEIYAHGRPDSSGLNKNEIWDDEDTVTKHTRVEFIQGGSSYTMDTIHYNFKTKKAFTKGVATKDGEGYLLGRMVKMMPDKTINIANARFTTCDSNHPHFYLAMTKSKTIPGKKTIFGPAYMVMEDVPIYFLGLPLGFFPMATKRQSGVIVPEWGEEIAKGFFLKNGGYYFALNDYVDLAFTGGLYTLNSWETNLSSRYVKRYTHSGNLNFRFTKDVIGQKGDANAVNMNNYNLVWSHTQDPKFKPNSTFSASVNFTSSGFNKYGAQNMNQHVSAQNNSTISYSKNWANTPISLSTNLQASQNIRDTSLSLSLPNFVLSVSRINPFKRREQMGRERWYEKVNFTYTGNFMNRVDMKEKDLFKPAMIDKMQNGMLHTVPLTTSINVLKYFNFTPSATYHERWYFRKIDKSWDPIANQLTPSDTTNGFYRLYDYTFSTGLSTKIYGTFQFKNKNGLVRAVRHMLTPNISFNYTPDFGKTSYGYYKNIQTNAQGDMTPYSPFEKGIHGIPGRNQNVNLGFGLAQTLEMKVRNKADTSGMRKIKVIDELRASSSYNFLADSMNLAIFPLAFRTSITKEITLNVNATLDPYSFDPVSKVRYNRFMLRDGRLGRITSANTSFGYSFNSSKRKSSQPAVNDPNNNQISPLENPTLFSQQGIGDMDPQLRRQMMTARYYDFSIPWNLGFNYTFYYTNSGVNKSVVQTLGFNGSVTLTDKWGFTFSGGYDIRSRKITPGTVSVTRDLHCWQMHFNWVPVGYRQSWSFGIAVKASMLKDLKYDRSRSHYDNLLDQ